MNSTSSMLDFNGYNKTPSNSLDTNFNNLNVEGREFENDDLDDEFDSIYNQNASLDHKEPKIPCEFCNKPISLDMIITHQVFESKFRVFDTLS